MRSEELEVRNQNGDRRTPAKTFRGLVVRQKAHAFGLAACRSTETFPKQETYGLCSQLRRAAVSVAANIVEGFRKIARADKVRFMNTARGSIEEYGYFSTLAEDLSYGVTNHLMALLEEERRLLNAYSRAILTSGS